MLRGILTDCLNVEVYSTHELASIVIGQEVHQMRTRHKKYKRFSRVPASEQSVRQQFLESFLPLCSEATEPYYERFHVRIQAESSR